MKTVGCQNLCGFESHPLRHLNASLAEWTIATVCKTVYHRWFESSTTLQIELNRCEIGWGTTTLLAKVGIEQKPKHSKSSLESSVGAAPYAEGSLFSSFVPHTIRRRNTSADVQAARAFRDVIISVEREHPL